MLKLVIIVIMWSLDIKTWDKALSVLEMKLGSTLPLSFIVHWLAKKSLNNFAFSLKFVTYTPLLEMGGIFVFCFLFANFL